MKSTLNYIKDYLSTLIVSTNNTPPIDSFQFLSEFGNVQTFLSYSEGAAIGNVLNYSGSGMYYGRLFANGGGLELYWGQGSLESMQGGNFVSGNFYAFDKLYNTVAGLRYIFIGYIIEF